MDFSTCTAQQWIENEENFLKHLQDETILNKIPLLNVNEPQHLQNHRLVRFRGMIQDMHSPEFYLEKFEVIDNNTKVRSIRNGKYCEETLNSENEEVVSSSQTNVRGERHPYSVISIPGLNDWVKTIEEEQFKLIENAQAVPEVMDTSECNTPTNSKYSKDFILNFPLPNPNGKACLLKIYREYSELKINDICEFIGFLTLTENEIMEENNSSEPALDAENFNPPTSIVPKIHCVHFKKLEHSNPLVNLNETVNWNFIRKELLILLTQLMLGDKLAAEYLIYHLISSVYQRREFMALGNFALNISNVPIDFIEDYVGELYKFIELLVPKSHYLPMTLENMNELSFVPEKNYDVNRLISGTLQLSANTHVVLDETKLMPGKLNSPGVENVKTLMKVIKDQEISYKFNFYDLNFECDIPFLIFSEGKSMINSDIQISLIPDNSCILNFSAILEAARHFLKPELLNQIRKYLTLARLIKYEITSEGADLIEREFLKMREEGPCTGDDLHKMLVLSKLVCISQGKTCLDEEAWKKSCELERERKLRFKK